MDASVESSGPTSTRPPRRARSRPVGALTALGTLALLAAGCTLRPFEIRDLVRSLDEFAPREHLRSTASRPQLVVLQHGMLRSAWSLWRLEDALEGHGYEVLNSSYPSTQDSIEEHAAALDRELEARLAQRDGELPAIHFVGHSMGGLVIRSYLSRPDARPAASCIFLGTPQRGAELARNSADGWLFKTFGGASAEQLVPTHSFYAGLTPLRAPRIGCLFGSRGDAVGWSETIPGDDDGRVGTGEAQLPEQTDSRALRLGHSALANADVAIEQVLCFLRHGEFAQHPN